MVVLSPLNLFFPDNDDDRHIVCHHFKLVNYYTVIVGYQWTSRLGEMFSCRTREPVVCNRSR